MKNEATTTKHKRKNRVKNTNIPTREKNYDFSAFCIQLASYCFVHMPTSGMCKALDNSMTSNVSC